MVYGVGSNVSLYHRVMPRSGGQISLSMHCSHCTAVCFEVAQVCDPDYNLVLKLQP